MPTKDEKDDSTCWACGIKRAAVFRLTLPDGLKIWVGTCCHRIVVELMHPEFFETRAPKSDLPVLKVTPDWKPKEGRMRSLSTTPEVYLDVDRLQEQARRNRRYQDTLNRALPEAPRAKKHKQKPTIP